MQKETQSNQEAEDEEIIHHAGDKGFKAIMQVKESALEYMEKFFPKLYAHLDLDNFELDTTNYVKKDFKEFYSDVVYQTSLKSTDNSKNKTKKRRKPVKIVLLFEHKKAIDSYFLLILQLLEYIVIIWRNDVQNQRKPSVIIPIVVYQGKKGLKPKELHDLFKHIPDELRQYLPNIKLLLTNVHDLLDENILALEEKGLLRSLFLAYTYTERKDRITDMLVEIFKFFKYRDETLDFFQLLFEFVSKEDYLSADEVNKLFGHYLSPYQKEDVMTSYQVWKQEGLKEGRQEGRQEGLEEGSILGAMKKTRLVVLRGKWEGGTARFLANVSELPYSEVENLFKGYDKVYELWQTKVGTAHTSVPYLSDEEVKYLMNLFEKNKNTN